MGGTQRRKLDARQKRKNLKIKNEKKMGRMHCVLPALGNRTPKGPVKDAFQVLLNAPQQCLATLALSSVAPRVTYPPYQPRQLSGERILLHMLQALLTKIEDKMEVESLGLAAAAPAAQHHSASMVCSRGCRLCCPQIPAIAKHAGTRHGTGAHKVPSHLCHRS